MKHSPGPWRFEVTFVNGTTGRLAAADGTTVAYIAPYRLEDANLIAAAPQMYEALDRLVDLTRSDYRLLPAIDQAVDALAAARGGKP